MNLPWERWRVAGVVSLLELTNTPARRQRSEGDASVHGSDAHSALEATLLSMIPLEMA